MRVCHKRISTKGCSLGQSYKIAGGKIPKIPNWGIRQKDIVKAKKERQWEIERLKRYCKGKVRETMGD
jgi:hypothetical protein